MHWFMRLKPLALVMSLNLLALFSARFANAAEPVTPPEKSKFQLFLLAGQSNMAGRGKVAELTAAEKAPNPRVLALNQAGGWQAAEDPIHWDKAGAGVGIGKFFGKIVADKNPGVVVGLIPTACGGSPISTWQPGKHHDQTKSNPYDDCLTRARAAMQVGTLKAILWHQGESDSNVKAAPVYEQKLEELINRLRTDLGAPDVPFIIGQLGQFPVPPAKPWTPERVEVDRAQKAVAAKLKNVYYVSAEGLLSGGDNLHFSTAAQRTFAERYAEAYFKALAQAKK